MEKKQTMLIVDDKEINRAILASYFRDEFNILQAEDGQETLDYVYSQPVDIIMLDLVMPKMSGMEVLDKLKTNPFGTNHNDLGSITVIYIAQIIFLSNIGALLNEETVYLLALRTSLMGIQNLA